MHFISYEFIFSFVRLCYLMLVTFQNCINRFFFFFFFLPFWGSWTTSEEKIITVLNCYGKHVSKSFPLYSFCRQGATLALTWSVVCVHLMNASPIFTPLLALVWFPPTPEIQYPALCQVKAPLHAVASWLPTLSVFNEQEDAKELSRVGGGGRVPSLFALCDFVTISLR